MNYVLLTMFYLAMWLVWGFCTMLIARRNGRNEATAFIMGVLFGVFALIGYLIAGKKKEEKKEDK